MQLGFLAVNFTPRIPDWSNGGVSSILPIDPPGIGILFNSTLQLSFFSVRHAALILNPGPV
jgi:hypothetical protein